VAWVYCIRSSEVAIQTHWTHHITWRERTITVSGVQSQQSESNSIPQTTYCLTISGVLVRGKEAGPLNFGLSENNGLLVGKISSNRAKYVAEKSQFKKVGKIEILSTHNLFCRRNSQLSVGTLRDENIYAVYLCRKCLTFCTFVDEAAAYSCRSSQNSKMPKCQKVKLRAHHFNRFQLRTFSFGLVQSDWASRTNNIVSVRRPPSSDSTRGLTARIQTSRRHQRRREVNILGTAS